MSALDDALVTTRALAELLTEETQALSGAARATDLKAGVAAKARLADALTAALEAVKSAGVAPLRQDPATLRALRAALADLAALLDANARAQARRRALAEGLVGAIVAEAQAMAGPRLARYGHSTATDAPARPISIDDRV